MVIGYIVITIELIMAFLALFWMIIAIVKRTKELYCVIRPFVLWLSPSVFVSETILLMFFVHTFTCAMGI